RRGRGARRRRRPAGVDAAAPARASAARRGVTDVALDDVRSRVHARLVIERPAVRLRDRVHELVCEEAPLLGPDAMSRVAAAVMAEAVGLGALEPLLADIAVTDVMVNGPGPVWIERDGRLSRTAIELDRAAIDHLVEKIVAPLGLRVD